MLNVPVYLPAQGAAPPLTLHMHTLYFLRSDLPNVTHCTSNVFDEIKGSSLGNNTNIP